MASAPEPFCLVKNQAPQIPESSDCHRNYGARPAPYPPSAQISSVSWVDRTSTENVNGTTIDPAEQPFVFDKFFRGRQNRSSQKGTGMGLAIAKAIMEAHGGGITLSSSQGGGASFTLWLPIH